MKFLPFFLITSFFSGAKARKIDSIYVHLYTDSLKKGTYNYINVDGLLSTGSYLPLDNTQLVFSASAGKFTGNSLWIDDDFTAEKVTIKVLLKSNPKLLQQFDIFIKRTLEIEKLKTEREIMGEINKGGKSKEKAG